VSSAISNSSVRDGLGLLVGAGVAGFDAGMIGYVLPAMRADTGADALVASWLVSVYVAGQLAAIPVAAWAVRRAGGATAFRACAALAALGALLAFLARDTSVLVAARLVQGLGIGPLLPVAAAIVATQWAPERQGRLMGLLSLAYGLCYLGSTVVAPWALGLGWRTMFGFSCAAAAIAAIATARDTGAPALELGRPLLGVDVNRQTVALALLSLGTGVGQAVVVYFPTLAVQRLRVSPGEAAVLMLPLVVAGVGTTVAITALLDRLGAKTILTAGAVATLTGVAVAAFAPPLRALFLIAAALLGVGITALCGGPLRYAAGRAVPASQQGPAQGGVALLTNVGVLAGSAMIGAVGARGMDERAALEFAMGIACALIAFTLAPVGVLAAHRR
jgi:MFS family permease